MSSLKRQLCTHVGSWQLKLHTCLVSGAHFHPTLYQINAGNTDKDYDGNNLQHIQSVCKERKVFFPPCSGKKLTKRADISLILCRLCLARGLCCGGCSVTSHQEHTGRMGSCQPAGSLQGSTAHCPLGFTQGFISGREGVQATSHMLQVKTADRRSPRKREQFVVRLKQQLQYRLPTVSAGSGSRE